MQEQNKSLITIIDIQEKLLNAVFNKEILSDNAEIIAKTAKILSIPMYISEQYPKGLGSTVSFVADNLPNNTVKVEKMSFNVFDDKGNFKLFKNYKKNNIIVCGIETHICVYQTVSYLLNKGYKVTVLSDCCGSRTEKEHFSALEVMRHEGADIKTVEMVIFEFLKTAKHPNFKEIQSLIK